MEDQNIEKKPDESVGIILGIISLVCAVTGFLTIVGLVLGIIATVKGNNVKKEGGSSAGFILGVLGIVFNSTFMLIVLIFASFAIHAMSTMWAFL